MSDPALVEALCRAIRDTHQRCDRPVLIGISGVQGSGKSTLCSLLEGALIDTGLSTATLSLDDLYLTRAERRAMAAKFHPLFATRGVPGTHDLALADSVITRLLTGHGEVAIPRFDKGCDDRAAESLWPVVVAPLDVLLFEGWCIGATPEPESALDAAVNALEAIEDPDLTWRRHVNDRLRTDYARLFARLDMLIVLQAPGFESVRGWRRQQEAMLKARDGGSAGMTPPMLDRFIAHFERVSRNMLATAPPEGAIVVALDKDRRVCGLRGLPPGALRK